MARVLWVANLLIRRPPVREEVIKTASVSYLQPP